MTLAAKNKSFAALWNDLNTARHRLEEDQKKEQQVKESLSAATNEEIIKAVRKQFRSDDDLVQSLLDLQAGKARIVFVPADPGNSGDDAPGDIRDKYSKGDEEEYEDE